MDKLRGIHVEKPDVCDSTVDSTVHVDSTQSVHVESTWKLRYSLMGYLIGDPHILLVLFVSLLEKSLGFVFKEILITQT